MSDFIREDFLNFWPDGYQECFGSNYPFKDKVISVVDRYKNESGTALDIGCGDGFWTMNILEPRFKHTMAVDLIKKPERFSTGNVSYIQLANADYTLPALQNESIDFAYSFGMFCHLSNSAVSKYVENISRVMKPGAYGVLMFANWPRRFGNTYGDDFREKPHLNNWFYSDMETVKRQITESGLLFVEDSIPDFRDTLAVVKKEGQSE